MGSNVGTSINGCNLAGSNKQKLQAMKTFVFCILTDYLSEIFEGVQAENVTEARKLIESRFPSASRINYEYSY